MKINQNGIDHISVEKNLGAALPTADQKNEWNSVLSQYSSGAIDQSAALDQLMQKAESVDGVLSNQQESLVVTLTELERDIRYTLLKELMKIGDDETDKKIEDHYAEENILYNVPDGTEAAEVDPYWNAENTSQRLVDFALSFRGYFADKSDVEYLEEVRAAMLEGYARAHESMGFTDATIPSDLAKLYNDTYHSTMSKLDALLVAAKKSAEKDS